MTAMQEQKKKKASLIKILKFVMAALVPTSIIALLIGIYAIKDTRHKSYERLNATMNYHIDQLNNQQYQLTYYMTDILANSENAVNLQNMRVANTLAPYWIISIMDDLQTMQNLINPGFSFFVTVPDHNLKSCKRSTLDDYAENLAMQVYIETHLDEIPLAGYLTKIQEVDGQMYLVSACKKRGVYLASWIRLEQLFFFMESVIQSDDGFYLLVDSAFSPITQPELFEKAGLKLDENGQVQTKLNNTICTLQWTNIGIGVATIDQQDMQTGETNIYLSGILLLCGVVLIFCCYIIYYFRHYIEQPLQFFQNHVNDYLKERRFTKRYGFAELDEVENAFSALESQVEELKIDIYEEKLKRTRTELEFLQNQIKPHFFVNCFNIIIGMAEWERFDQIQDFCMLLSSYVRYTLCDGFETVSLEEELSQSRDFLEIQNIRFDTATTFSEETGESPEYAQIPPMTILSFIENSIKHNKFKVDNLQLQVKVRHIPGGLNGLLEILYTDNGVGMDEKQCQETKQMLLSVRENVLGKGENVTFSGEQVGIQNVYRRMLLLYGERAKMELLSGPGEGYAMRITIPNLDKTSPAIQEK